MDTPSYFEENSDELKPNLNDIELGKLLDTMKSVLENRIEFKIKCLNINSNRTGLVALGLPSATGVALAHIQTMADELYPEYAKRIEELTK